MELTWPGTYKERNNFWTLGFSLPSHVPMWMLVHVQSNQLRKCANAYLSISFSHIFLLFTPSLSLSRVIAIPHTRSNLIPSKDWAYSSCPRLTRDKCRCPMLGLHAECLGKGFSRASRITAWERWTPTGTHTNIKRGTGKPREFDYACGEKGHRKGRANCG